MEPRTPTRKELEASLEQYFYKSVRQKLGGDLVKITTRKGFPDRLVMLPGNRMFLVELKADGGSASPAQIYIHEKINALGIDVHVLEGRGQVFQWCQERMKDFDEELAAATGRKAARSPEYQRGYKAGQQAKRAAEKAAR